MLKVCFSILLITRKEWLFLEYLDFSFLAPFVCDSKQQRIHKIFKTVALASVILNSTSIIPS